MNGVNCKSDRLKIYPRVVVWRVDKSWLSSFLRQIATNVDIVFIYSSISDIASLLQCHYEFLLIQHHFDSSQTTIEGVVFN